MKDTPTMRLAKAALSHPALRSLAEEALVWERNRVEVERWLKSGDTGLSSRYLLAALSGKAPRVLDRPHDGGDFGRCVRMLRAIPRLRPRLEIMLLGHGGSWRALVTHWAELEALYDADERDTLYRRIQELTRPHEAEEGLVRVEPPDAGGGR